MSQAHRVKSSRDRLTGFGRRRPFLFGVAVLLVIVAFEGALRIYSYVNDRGYFTFGLPDSLPQIAEQRMPARVGGTGTALVVNSPLDDRANDPRSLSRGEVFRGNAKQPSDGDVKLALRGIRMETRCADAVWGTELRAALQAGGCNQVVRGLYTDRAEQRIGQVTIFNLRNADASRRIVTWLESRYNSGFVFPLAGSKPLDRLGRGYSYGWADVHGHYVLLTWAQRTDGTEPSARETDLRSVDNALGRVENALIKRGTDAA